MWLLISVPFMVLAVGMAVLPVLVGTIRYHGRESTRAAAALPQLPVATAPKAELHGVEAVERRLAIIERALLASADILARPSDEMLAS